jgi:two-component system, LytTR family, response regulator
MSKLRVLIADDERPAREYLKSLLLGFDEIEIVGQAADGTEALDIIKSAKPDLALLDLQMPEMSGLEVVKMLRKTQMPLVAFVTAFDEYAVKAFELNAVDYLLKPVERERLAETIRRAMERIERDDWRASEARKVASVAEVYETSKRTDPIDRIPVRKRDQIFLVPADEVASIIADGELLHITTEENQSFVINFRLKDLEARLDGRKFIRLSRAAIVNLNMVAHISPQPGGMYSAILKNGQEIPVSRLHSRLLRARVLKL